MNWFRENGFLGAFLIALFFCVAGSVWFLFSAKSDWDEASTRFNQTAAELDRLERLAPYPSAENLRKMKAYGEDYASALTKLKSDLANRGAPAEKIQPNEFQSRLRIAMNAIADKARANKVKLPDKFYLGFDEYSTALPTSELAATLLGQELLQIEWLVSGLLDAHVDGLTAFRRTPLREERGTAPLPAAPAKSPIPNVPASMFERNVVELTFVSAPSAARKIINQIAGANQEFCIIRLLHVRNEKEKGPPREVAAETSTTAPSIPAPSLGVKPTPAAALNFIVGNEKIETTAKIEIVRFVF